MIEIDQQFLHHIVALNVLVVLHKDQLVPVQTPMRDELKVLEELHDWEYLSAVQIVELELLATLLFVLQPQNTPTVEVKRNRDLWDIEVLVLCNLSLAQINFVE